MTPYRRKFFIKDLFSPRGLFNSFDVVQFESGEDFLMSLQKDWMDMGRNQKIIIKINGESACDVSNVIHQTGVLTTDRIALDITSLDDVSILNPLLESEGKLNLQMNLDNVDIEKIHDLWAKLPQKWAQANRFILNVFIDAQNYKNQLNSIIEVLMKTPMRFFNLSLDYESLSELTFKEFEDFKLRVSDLRNWSYDTRFSGTKGLVYSFFSNSDKKIIVKDSKLYINEYALRDGSFILDLTDKEGLTGEDLKNKELATFRAYLELREYDVSMFSTVEGLRKTLIDPYFNKKMTTSYIFLPPITQLMLTLFN